MSQSNGSMAWFQQILEVKLTREWMFVKRIPKWARVVSVDFLETSSSNVLWFLGKKFKSQEGSYLRRISFLRCHLDEDKIHLFSWLSRNDKKASEHSLIITWCLKLEFH